MRIIYRPSLVWNGFYKMKRFIVVLKFNILSIKNIYYPDDDDAQPDECEVLIHRLLDGFFFFVLQLFFTLIRLFST